MGASFVLVVTVVVIEKNFGKFTNIFGDNKNPRKRLIHPICEGLFGGDKGTRTPALLNAIQPTNRMVNGFVGFLVVIWYPHKKRKNATAKLQ